MKKIREKWIFLYVLGFLLPVLLCACAFFGARAAYRSETNRQMAILLGNIREKYPELEESEVLCLLQDPSALPAGESFLEKYGLYNGAFAGAAQRRFAAAALCCAVGGGLGVFLCCGAVSAARTRARRREAAALTDFLKTVGGGNYTLPVGEDNEGELSKLQNEIYKLTVLLRETAAESERRSAALSVSLADISHQIRTPLASASVMLENVADAPEIDAATRADFINEARRQLLLISELCVTLLRLSKFDSGAVQLRPAEITARQLVDAATGNLSVLLDLKNITVETGGDLDAVFTADLYWQTEALTNILKNAAEHSPENAAIRISAERSGLFVTLRISDEGDGIDEADLPHIFERFYKAKNAGADSFGVGLNLARTVIEKDNGSLRAVSQKGRGTTFVIAYRLI